MNAKTSSHRCVHSFNNDASNQHATSEGPGALLDMLAEVASRTLRSESMRAKDGVGEAERETRCKSRRLLSMPPTQLVKRFSLFTGDELKRRYSYECNLVPGCRQKYTSFASDSRAKISITSHLVDHLDRLRNEREASPRGDSWETTRIAETVSERSGKRGRSRRQEYYRDKENEMALDSREKDEAGERARTELVAAEKRKELESKVLDDHSYYERVGHPDESAGRRDGPNEREEVRSPENIVLMVVEGERCRVEQLPACRDTAEEASAGAGSSQTTTASLVTCKPKGKAKFIGTSKEEREMALLLMERIKKRGNPSGGNLQCRICVPPRSFTAPTTLVSHYRSHAGIKPYECRICRSVFTRRHSLKYHMLIHQNQTRFTCADCGKKFRHPSHFREHRRRHTGESPFACQDCGQRFKTRNTYKRHLKTRHGKVLTTSGELLCLTEDEFDKVQTNRKKRSQRRSVSEDYSAAIQSLNDDVGGILYDGIVNENGEEGLVEIELDALTGHVDAEYAHLELPYDRTLEMDELVRGIVVESLSIDANDDNAHDCCSNNNNTHNNNNDVSGNNNNDVDSVFLDRDSHEIKAEKEGEGGEEQQPPPPRCVVVLASDQDFGANYLASDHVLLSPE